MNGLGPTRIKRMTMIINNGSHDYRTVPYIGRPSMPGLGFKAAGSQIGPKLTALTESHFACTRNIVYRVLRAILLKDCKTLVYHLGQGIGSF